MPKPNALGVNPTKPELLAVGCSDPYVRLYDRRMLKCKDLINNYEENLDSFHLPTECVKYYTPGHLPLKMREYQRKFRMLAVTYLTFSPDGRELLVNLGGEQIYLYDLNDDKQPFQLLKTELLHGNTNGINGFNGRSEYRGQATENLPERIEALKERANSEFEKRNYIEAIVLYNQAISLCPKGAVLYSNRAAALINRKWDGDVYAALRDCATAISLNKHQYKAYYRMCRCLLLLQRHEEAKKVLGEFTQAFPDQTHGPPFAKLEFDLKEASRNRVDLQEQLSSKYFWYFRSGITVPAYDEVITNTSCKKKKMRGESKAMDYGYRFCGHCNTTTDIKEASFLESSDDGSFFIWDRNTTNIVRVLKGDNCIVNCLQPHRDACFMATSGVDHVVRLWSPLPDGEANDRNIVNTSDAAVANQRRMHADPWELMILNMGYRIRRGSQDSDDESGDDREGNNHMQCRPF